MSRKPIISGNWKMNLNHFEAIQLVQKLSYLLDKKDYKELDIAIYPSFTNIRSIQTLIDADQIPLILGAQNCSQATSGAYTGEVSAHMLAKLAVKHVVCGHSERRTLMGETNEIVNAKVKAVFKADMTPVLCVGESAEEREAEKTEEVLVAQIEAALHGSGAAKVASMIIAYEPVWAIGTGAAATADDAQAGCELIRSTVRNLKGDEAADQVRLQYGGSVKPTNILDYMRKADVDGALVGGASLDSDAFAAICQYRLQA